MFLDVFLVTGAAFTKHLIHLYAYPGSNDLRQHLEVSSESDAFPERLKSNTYLTCLALLLQIDAHVGSVNDIAFAHPNKQLCVVTCGDDKLIKVREFT